MFYAVSTLLVGMHSNASQEPLWQECIFLVEADSPEAAREQATQLARQRETRYETSAGAIEWRFHAVQSVFEIETELLAHGMEVFSRFLRNFEALSLLEPFDDIP
jgi:hypothetical protein